MKKLWSFLNAPIVVVLIALILWPLLTITSTGYALKAGIGEIRSAVKDEVVEPFRDLGRGQDEALKTKLQVRKKIMIENIRILESSWKGRVKVIGTVNNQSDKIIKSINITASFYENGELVDVHQEWLSKIDALPSGESANFVFTKELQEGQSDEQLNVNINLASFAILQ